jgi:hypothetical protein
MTRKEVLALLLAAALAGCIADPPRPRPEMGDRRPSTTPNDISSSDAVRFSEGGMAGHSEVRWDPAQSSISYESFKAGEGSQAWNRQPSAEEWVSFWTAMDRAGVWQWKADYGHARHTDCAGWSLQLRHGTKTMRSWGCSMFPENGAWEQVVVAVNRLRGGPGQAASQALLLAKQLDESSDWGARIEAARALGAMGPIATVAAPALIRALDPPPLPGRGGDGCRSGPATAENEVDRLVSEAESALDRRKFDVAISRFDQAVKLDPECGRAIRGRALALYARHGAIRPESAIAQQRAAQPAELGKAAAQALASVGESVVPALVQALKDASLNRKRQAATALETMGPRARAAVPALTEALRDPALAEAAGRALSSIDRESAAQGPR